MKRSERLIVRVCLPCALIGTGLAITQAVEASPAMTHTEQAVVHEARTQYGLPATNATCWSTGPNLYSCWVWGPHFKAVATGNAKGAEFS